MASAPNSPGWRSPGVRPVVPRGSTSALAWKRRLLFAVILALAGAVAGVLYWLRPIPEPYFLAGVIDQNEDPRIPVAAWARHDSAALQQVRWKGQGTFAQQQRQMLEKELARLAEHSDVGIVLYLNAPAVTSEGKVYLLPGDARLDDARTWLSLEELLTRLHASPAPHKLLLLDIMRPLTDARLGILASDVAERALPVLEAAVGTDPSLLILCSCSPGQFSLAMGELRRSAFAYYLEQGLLGGADGYNDAHRTDNRVSARELARFVTARVDRWARQCHGVRQTPLLLAGSAVDFPLVGVQEVSAGPPELPDLEDYPGLLRKGWELLDAWRDLPSQRVPVPLYRRLEAALVRAEQHWRGGDDWERIATMLKPPLAAFQQEQDKRSAAGGTPRSLAEMARMPGRKLPDTAAADVRTRLRDMVELEERIRTARPEEKEKAGRDREKLAADKKEFLKAFKDRAFDLAWILFETAAVEPNPRPAHLHVWNDLLVEYESVQPGQLDFNEARLLRRLAGWAAAVKDDKRWPAEGVALSLRLGREEERLAGCTPRALDWVRALRDRAVARRREGHRLLLEGDPGSWTMAETVLREALKECQTISRHARIVQDALSTRDEALALLPGYRDYLEQQPGELKTWTAALETARDLHLLLESGETPPPLANLSSTMDRMEALTGNLRVNLERLGEPRAGDRWRRILDRADRPDVALVSEIRTLLRCHWLSATQRVQLMGAERTVGRELLLRALRTDSDEDRARLMTPAPGSHESAPGIAREREAGLQRARMAIALLRFEGVADVSDLERALSADSPSPEGDPLTGLGPLLRKAWVRQRSARD